VRGDLLIHVQDFREGIEAGADFCAAE